VIDDKRLYNLTTVINGTAFPVMQRHLFTCPPKLIFVRWCHRGGDIITIASDMTLVLFALF
jgi:hypothetical protein